MYFSLVFNDLLSPVYVNRYTNFTAFTEGASPTSGVEFFSRSYDFSVCFRTKNVFPGGIVRDIVFTIDYHFTWDSLKNPNSNSLLDIGAGIELQLLRAFWLRAGFQQMLPGAGFGVDLGWIKLDLAVFGETFGDQLSDFQGASFSLGFSFRY